MTTKFKLSIPEPCHENWNQMSKTNTGKFCNVCTKNVVDFTQKLPNEIQHYFQNTTDQRICGRLSHAQLDQIVILIPKKIIMTQRCYQNIFLIALFVTMGTTLFSCKDQDDQKKPIQKIQVVKDSTKESETTVGILMTPIENCNNVISQLPPPKIDQIKFPKQKEKSTVSVGMIFVKPIVLDSVQNDKSTEQTNPKESKN